MRLPGSAETSPVAFRIFSHAFTIRCDDPEMQGYVSTILRRFVVAGGGVRDEGLGRYEILDLGPNLRSSRYRLIVNGNWVLGSGDPSHVLDDLLTRVNLDTAAATEDLVLVHAGVVSTPGGRAVLIPAGSGSGKTTLVSGLVRADFGYLSDEAAVLDPNDGRVQAFPKHLTLKSLTRDRFPEARPNRATERWSGDKWHVDPDRIRAGAVAEGCEVGFVVAYRYESGATTAVTALTQAEACVELARNLMLARRDGVRALSLLAAICAKSKNHRLLAGDLDEAVQAITILTSGT
jgi:hypothetical protein